MVLVLLHNCFTLEYSCSCYCAAIMYSIVLPIYSEFILKKYIYILFFFNSRILGQGSGTDDWVRPPDHTSASSIRSDSDRPRGEGSEKGAGRHQRPGGVVLPASGERRPPVWTL